MLTVWKSREMRIADLSLHGWEPVVNRTTLRHGVWNEQFGVGFSARNDPAGDSSVKHLDRDHRHNSYELCDWSCVTDWHLDAIDERLRRT